MTLRQLLEQRAALLAQMRALVDRAEAREAGEQNLTPDEEASFQQMEADLQALQVRIERAQQLEALERASATYEVPASQRSQRSDDAGASAEEQRDAFRHFLRTGELRAGQALAPDSAGGYLVPDEVSRQILTAADEAQVLTPRAQIIETLAGVYHLPVATHGTAAWVAENGSETESPETFAVVSLTPYKAKAVIPASDEVLQDAGQLEAFINQVLPRNVATLAEAAFVNGSGSGQPTGLLTGAATGKTTASGTAITFDEVLDLYGSLKSQYVPRSVFVMNPATAIHLMKIKTGVASDNRFIWTASLSADAPAMLLGRPVLFSSSMPTIATGEKTIAFGDLGYYAIARRPSFSIQRDPYSQAQTGKVVFRLFQRYDGKLTLSEAVKVLVQA